LSNQFYFLVAIYLEFYKFLLYFTQNNLTIKLSKHNSACNNNIQLQNKQEFKEQSTTYMNLS